MVQKVTPSLPSRLFSAVVPENRIVRIVLGILAVIVVVRVVLSLAHRQLAPSKKLPEQGNEAANRHKEAGKAYLDSDKQQEALAEFLKGYECNPTDAVLRAELCLELAYLYKNIDQAIEKIEEIFTLNLPTNSLVKSAHHIRGIIAEKIEDYEKAQEHLEKNIALETETLDKSVAQLILARVHCKKKEFIKAQEVSQNVIEQHLKDQDISNLFVDLGTLYGENDRFEQAYTYFGHALDTCPDGNGKGHIYHAAANVYYRQENFVACWEQLTRAIEQGGKMDRDWMGTIYNARGCVRQRVSGDKFPEDRKMHEAFIDFAQALANISPNNFNLHAQILYNRAVLYRQEGREADAMADLREALKLPITDAILRTQIQKALQS